MYIYLKKHKLPCKLSISFLNGKGYEINNNEM